MRRESRAYGKLRAEQQAAPERIVAVAHRLGDVILTAPPPARHHVLFLAMEDMEANRGGPENSGFLTSTGRYVDRREAFRIATDARQRLARRPGGYDGPELFSEDVW